ncbi:mycofactocin-coupled SDR family oxidoreductase [Frankia sp. CNm7]|uniref:Mycofactocin-coupled SDR family oxidoreductase n=1 Tax=Frankia nepalensis TaxID=1836974 RepID=A0A937UU12_9ACTN|nr:mycofactocin-coupled SDR family oxidoreductase [Frankia nepalensis]MBL7497397.1 mycofactocin-coupled SDR family oxidoreductase [Frankia nepalensis]MBL7512100.1 mycofactocin-coupled SDR family oxidoreductase [Frankia nepalensis]MBL7520005.1 mycofactocin-coupled SDR family oxidoreductase [Frankia nepalensis]MBL7631800.1 mycofactocin-coupled SDR family oxidoreductase [Frankia nepalensis]
MGRFDGRVVLITGGARGQGRSHALRFASEGADVAVLDAPAQPASVVYPVGTEEELAQTAKAVEELGRRCVAISADVREPAALAGAVETTVGELGRLDFCLANAGVLSHGRIAEMDDQTWRDVIDVNLTGVFNTLRAVLPGMIEQGFGRIVATASLAGRSGFPYLGHYSAAKWGVIGLVKTVALEVATMGITVNAVLPTSVDTPMITSPEILRQMIPGVEDPGREHAAAAFGGMNAIPVPWVEPADVSGAMAFLCSDDARYITGETLTVTAGAIARNSA